MLPTKQPDSTKKIVFELFHLFGPVGHPPYPTSR